MENAIKRFLLPIVAISLAILLLAKLQQLEAGETTQPRLMLDKGLKNADK